MELFRYMKLNLIIFIEQTVNLLFELLYS